MKSFSCLGAGMQGFRRMQKRKRGREMLAHFWLGNEVADAIIR